MEVPQGSKGCSMSEDLDTPGGARRRQLLVLHRLDSDRNQEHVSGCSYHKWADEDADCTFCHASPGLFASQRSRRP
eukprot:4090831-Pyramimonas_sp.AAC.1